MRIHRLTVPWLALATAGCVTTPPPPMAAESPVPKAEQVAAQESRQVPQQRRYKTKVSIARFTNETSYGRSLLYDADLDVIGKQASDMLASRLVKSGKFVVLERPDLTKITREQEIAGQSSLVGSDTVIIGSVTEFGRSVSGQTGFLSSTKTQVARAKVDIRLVDVKTSLAYFSATGAGEASTATGEVAGFGSKAEYDATLNDRAIAAAISDVIDALVSKLADRPWRTFILDVQGPKVFIGGGRMQGIQVGDVLAVLEPGKTVKSKQTGFDVTLPATQVATLRVVGLFGDSETNEGSVCEVVSGAVDPARFATLIVAGPGAGGQP
ncbi:MAG TPA: CsgG/HfaB family protein [Anaeromyxobacteraceae bacterium]|nr:CsgG/HfaB family protein [Anaeromyxobacteraceae bacterium]